MIPSFVLNKSTFYTTTIVYTTYVSGYWHFIYPVKIFFASYAYALPALGFVLFFVKINDSELSAWYRKHFDQLVSHSSAGEIESRILFDIVKS